jgi:hypothetical protein
LGGVSTQSGGAFFSPSFDAVLLGALAQESKASNSPMQIPIPRKVVNFERIDFILQKEAGGHASSPNIITVILR